MKFDPTKPVQTRSGRPVRILATDLPGRFPIGGLVEGFSNLDRWTSCGTWVAPGDELDLVNVPKRYVRWINIYGDAKYDADFCPYPSKEKANQCSNNKRIACVRVEFEEGEGLE